MTTQPLEDLLQWTLADRMTKALRASGIKSNDMAEYLGMSRTSVSNWINGRISPDTRTLRLFALRTGVPYEWLVTGDMNGQNGPGGGNVRPIDYKAGGRLGLVQLFPEPSTRQMSA